MNTITTKDGTQIYYKRFARAVAERLAALVKRRAHPNQVSVGVGNRSVG